MSSRFTAHAARRVNGRCTRNLLSSTIAFADVKGLERYRITTMRNGRLSNQVKTGIYVFPRFPSIQGVPFHENHEGSLTDSDYRQSHRFSGVIVMRPHKVEVCIPLQAAACALAREVAAHVPALESDTSENVATMEQHFGRFPQIVYSAHTTWRQIFCDNANGQSGTLMPVTLNVSEASTDVPVRGLTCDPDVTYEGIPILPICFHIVPHFFALSAMVIAEHPASVLLPWRLGVADLDGKEVHY